MDTILNTATLKECSSFPPGWHFKVLHGKQRGVFQLRIDDRYRIRFRWDEQYGAVDVTAGEFHDEDDEWLGLLQCPSIGDRARQVTSSVNIWTIPDWA
jgi:hypothetical protein